MILVFWPKITKGPSLVKEYFQRVFSKSFFVRIHAEDPTPRAKNLVSPNHKAQLTTEFKYREVVWSGAGVIPQPPDRTTIPKSVN
jgi:hypothetical protein